MRVKFHYTAAIMIALALSACQESKPAKQEAAAVPSQAGPEARPGITVAGGRLVLPAVAGNPGAAYFQIDNSAGANVAIAAIAINGTEKAEIHQTTDDKMMDVDSVDIAPSTSIKFEPGQLHVMVFNLAPQLKAGGTTEMTVTFADGDKVSAPLKIEAAGGGMSGMDH
jgi:periplasmic copper chaperone A